MSEPPCPHQPEPSPEGRLEELLVQALERLDAEGAPGVGRFLTEHPAEASRLRAHLQRLHRIGLSIRAVEDPAMGGAMGGNGPDVDATGAYHAPR